MHTAVLEVFQLQNIFPVLLKITVCIFTRAVFLSCGVVVVYSDMLQKAERQLCSFFLFLSDWYKPLVVHVKTN